MHLIDTNFLTPLFSNLSALPLFQSLALLLSLLLSPISDTPHWNMVRDLWTQYNNSTEIKEQHQLLSSICSTIVNHLPYATTQSYIEVFDKPDYFVARVAVRFVYFLFLSGLHHNPHRFLTLLEEHQRWEGDFPVIFYQFLLNPDFGAHYFTVLSILIVQHSFINGLSRYPLLPALIDLLRCFLTLPEIADGMLLFFPAFFNIAPFRTRIRISYTNIYSHT